MLEDMQRLCQLIFFFFAGDYVHRGIPLHMKFTRCGNKCFGFFEAIDVFTMEIDLWNDE